MSGHRINEHEAAHFLGLSVHTLRKDRALKGEYLGIPVIRIRRRVLYSPAELLAWQQANERR